MNKPHIQLSKEMHATAVAGALPMDMAPGVGHGDDLRLLLERF